MDYLPYSQEYMLAVSIMTGMLLGSMWDAYRLLRHFIKLGPFGTAIGDFIYWLTSIYIGITLIFDISYGNVRFFILLGFMTGALLYFYGISRYILRLLIFIVDKILKIIKRTIDFLTEPFKALIKKLRIILYPFKLKYEKIRNNAKKRYKFFKFRLKKISKNRKMSYNRRKQFKKINKRRRKEQTNARRTKDNRIKKKNQ
ncbi:spore cortex biosynthesis protein YabQ [Sedimentibacter sp.]|uniref:spore cortex biosynthesis protein YabQ n=1 Tax=Sedimentibacter sp. TaxID=1960295 RepID=UPI002899E730|nr:spore cortex biosynthesis protein YabQ [Sedimentibacter sp.]